MKRIVFLHFCDEFLAARVGIGVSEGKLGKVRLFELVAEAQLRFMVGVVLKFISLYV